MDRKLAAILAAYVVGCSRVMEVDEQGTSERLRTAAFRLRLALSLTDRAPARQGSTREIAADPVGAMAGAVRELLA